MTTLTLRWQRFIQRTSLTFAMHGRTAEAVPHFIRAVELQPEDANMRYALAHALLEVGRRSEAAAQFEETLRLDPNHAGAGDGLNRIRDIPHQ